MELRRTATRPKVLFGMELDWIPSRRDFMETLVAAYPFDYVIGGLHYLGLFSIGSGDWNERRDRPVLPAMTLIMKRWRATWPPPGWWM